MASTMCPRLEAAVDELLESPARPRHWPPRGGGLRTGLLGLRGLVRGLEAAVEHLLRDAGDEPASSSQKSHIDGDVQEQQRLCPCGNVLMPDAHFCRKCGQRCQEDYSAEHDAAEIVAIMRAREGSVLGPSKAMGHSAHKFRLLDRWIDLLHSQEELVEAESMQLQPQNTLQVFGGRRASLHNRARRNSKIGAIIEATTDTAVNFPAKFMGFLISVWWMITHPLSRFRVCWDAVGAMLLFIDMFLIPYDLAWDNSIGSSPFSYSMQITGMTFWTMDMLRNFVMGYIRHGVLVLNKTQIALEYVRGWFLLDLSCLVVDVMTLLLETMPMLRPFKLLRILRLARLVRLLKFQRFVTTVEDMLPVLVYTRLLLSVTVFVVMGVLLTVVHTLTCLWYFVGRLHGADGWVAVQTQEESLFTYTRAMHWVLAQFTPAPPPGNLRAMTRGETAFNICVIFFSLVVVGSVVSKINSTIMELRKATEVYHTRKRNLNKFLTRNHVPTELSQRINEFFSTAHYKASRANEDHFFLAMLSPSLKRQLCVVQRGPLLNKYPLFRLIGSAKADVFQDLCKNIFTVNFDPGDVVFAVGAWAEAMHITVRGKYMFETNGGDAVPGVDQATTVRPSQTRGIVQFGFAAPRLSRNSQTSVDTDSPINGGVDALAEGTTRHLIEDVAVFGNVCLYTKAAHTSSLTASTDADALRLTANDLMSIVESSPTCTVMVCEYANELLRRLGETDCGLSALQPQTVLEALEATTMATQVREFAQYQEMRSSEPEFKRKTSSSVSAQDLWIVRQQQLVRTLQSSRPFAVKSSMQNASPTHSPADYLKDVLAGRATPVREAVLSSLEDVFPELHEELGTYVMLSMGTERQRALSAMSSAVWLAADAYDEFVDGQDPAKRMTQELWNELQAFQLLRHFDAGRLMALLVFLAVRPLGKGRTFNALVPPTWKDAPEKAVLYVMMSVPQLVPSISQLDPCDLWFVESALQMHSKFNLAQLLQGENPPSSIALLRSTVNDIVQDPRTTTARTSVTIAAGKNMNQESLADELMHFYLLAWIASMSGLMGAVKVGSLFMDQQNASNVVLAVRAVLHTSDWAPTRVYWSFVWDRARQLGFRGPCTEANLAAARLACLCRARGRADLDEVAAALESLSREDRHVLSKAFLADGSAEKAFLFMFLPAFLANARSNAAVGLQRALQLVVDIIEALWITGWADSEEMTLLVDLSDLVTFTSEVRLGHVFEVCMAHAKFVQSPGCKTKDRVRLTMTSKNWNRVRGTGSAVEDRLADATQLMHLMRKRQERIEGTMAMVLQSRKAVNTAANEAGRSRGSKDHKDIASDNMGATYKVVNVMET